MRLIDADRVDFGKVFIGFSDCAKEVRVVAQNHIEEQPIAYDLDGVVRNVDKLREECADPFLEYDPEYFIDKAIEIIKSGVIG